MQVKDKIISVRVDQETLRAAKLVAGATCRPVSALCEYTLKDFILRNYPDAYKPGAKISIKID